MKICYLGDSGSCLVQAWARYFKNRGHEVYIMTSNFSPVQIPGVKVFTLGLRKPIPALTFSTRIIDTARLLKKIQPDVVHAHYIFGFGFLGSLSGYHPLIVTGMGNDIGHDSVDHPFIRTGVKHAIRNADIVSVKDEFAKERAILLGCDEKKIIIRHSYCNMDIFTPEARSEELRKRLGVNGHPTVLFTRRLNEEYRSGVILDAIAKVIESMPDVRFIMLKREKGLPEFLLKAKRFELSGHIKFIPEIPHSEMPALIASSDIYVDTFYPRHDVGGHGQGTNTIEAMSCGVPQILPDRREYQGDWCKALLYPKGNSNVLADAIITLARDEKLRKTLGKQSRASAQEFGNEEKIMKEITLLYQKLAEKYERHSRIG